MCVCVQKSSSWVKNIFSIFSTTLRTSIIYYAHKSYTEIKIAMPKKENIHVLFLVISEKNIMLAK